MGVTGLLQHLKEIQEPTNLQKYRGKALAVDTYGWLHRGLISCAQELCQDIPTRKYINSVMKKVDMLRHFGIEPYLVFDGSYLPTKAETANERRIKREEAKIKADLLVKQGKKSLAWKEFMKAAGVTPQMAKSIMVELDSKGVKYVVAPYEADPQMVYLEKMGIVDGILSEDSDLLIFGCNRLITKLNDYGDCVEICRENFSKVKSIPQLASYTESQLRLVAILSGCDYTKGINGVGLKTAFTLVRRFNNIEKILASLRTDGKSVPLDFEMEAKRADIAFQYQKVFNPEQQKLSTLNEVEPELDIEFEFLENCCGQTLEHEIHVGICNGRLHPNTFEILVAREQSLTNLRSISVNGGNKVGNMPVLATRSKSTPKMGSIDSFFGSSTSSSAKKVSLIRPSLAMKVQLPTPTSTKRDLTIARATTTSATATTTAITTTPSITTSPTTKKIRKVLAPTSSINVGGNSKFFDTILTQTKAKANWDISGDSDVPDEFSSSPVAIKKYVSPIKEQLQELKESISITKENIESFDVDFDEDEIEESPVKKQPTTRLSGLSQSLHERFLMKSIRSSVLLNPKTDKPVTPADLGLKMNLGKELKVSQAGKEGNGRVEEEDDEISEEEAIIDPPVVSQTTNLQRFAYRG